MSTAPRLFATTFFLATLAVLAIVATMPAADLPRAQEPRPDRLADVPLDRQSTTKNVPEPSLVVIAAAVAAMEGWSIWKRRRRAAHPNLIGTGAVGGRSSG
ncbi:MAG: hypothetical protein WCR51_03390 [Planctomycetia bacterium]